MFDLPTAADHDADHPARASADLPPVQSQGTLAMVSSRALLRGGRELVIRHGDVCYRLRHTRNDKLILTK